MMHGGQHTRIYDQAVGNSDGRRGRVCEITGRPWADIAHIDASGMGGRASAHQIENLMAMCREFHEWSEGRKDLKAWLKEQHGLFLTTGRTAIEREGLRGPVVREYIMSCYSKMGKRWQQHGGSSEEWTGNY